LARDNERNFCVRKSFAQRNDRRRGQNQITNSFQLNQEDIHGSKNCSGDL
jgi:hypothetical protein